MYVCYRRIQIYRVDEVLDVEAVPVALETELAIDFRSLPGTSKERISDERNFRRESYLLRVFTQGKTKTIGLYCVPTLSSGWDDQSSIEIELCLFCWFWFCFLGFPSERITH